MPGHEQIRSGYAYDGLQRLTSAVESGFSTNTYTYGYDTRGNRTNVTVNGVAQPTLRYNAANQVVGWTYDAAGNLLTDPTSGPNQTAITRSYDALNRVITQGGTTNVYTGDGTLVRSGAINYTQDLASPLSQILSDPSAPLRAGSHQSVRLRPRPSVRRSGQRPHLVSQRPPGQRPHHRQRCWHRAWCGPV